MNQNAIKALAEKLGRPTEAEGGQAPMKVRCECGTRHDGHHVGPLFRECKADAVRLVTVPFATHPSTGNVEIPMCQACAEYHERGGK
jgi:hypothetical protein